MMGHQNDGALQLLGITVYLPETNGRFNNIDLENNSTFILCFLIFLNVNLCRALPCKADLVRHPVPIGCTALNVTRAVAWSPGNAL